VNSDDAQQARVWLDAGWLVTGRALRTPPMITFARVP
jgi:hypothetical protein